MPGPIHWHRKQDCGLPSEQSNPGRLTLLAGTDLTLMPDYGPRPTSRMVDIQMPAGESPRSCVLEAIRRFRARSSIYPGFY